MAFLQAVGNAGEQKFLIAGIQAHEIAVESGLVLQGVEQAQQQAAQQVRIAGPGTHHFLLQLVNDRLRRAYGRSGKGMQGGGKFQIISGKTFLSLKVGAQEIMDSPARGRDLGA